MNRKCIELLWTGGFDSTFRLIELSFMDIDIIPVYVVDPKRKSKNVEIESMKKIILALNKKERTKAHIHEIEMINLDDIPSDEQITSAYNLIHNSTMLGSQHEWLARLGKHRPGMEMGTEGGDPKTSHILHAIQDYGKLVFDEEQIGKLDLANSSPEGRLVLGWFRFPIINRTEKEMVEFIHQWGYEDIVQLIWFCHNPLHGKPCGMCHPCEVKMESQMQFLLPTSAQKRYRCWSVIKKIGGVKTASVFSRVLRKLS